VDLQVWLVGRICGRHDSKLHARFFAGKILQNSPYICIYIFAAWFDQFDPSTKKGPMTHDPHLELPEELHVEATPAGF